jgi:RNA polymerase sigma-70 factor (ECF subfamily)
MGQQCVQPKWVYSRLVNPQEGRLTVISCCPPCQAILLQSAKRILARPRYSATLKASMSSPTNNQVFERIVRPHFDRLYRLAWRLTGSKADAEDLFQELLLKAFGKLDDLVAIEEPGSWLSRVMYNLFIDERRRFARRRMQTVEEGSLPGDGLAGLAGSSDPVQENQRFEKLKRLDTALARLSDEHRQVVLLHDTEGYKLAEIQDLTGTPIGTVKSRLHRARARLREILDADGTFSAADACFRTDRKNS